jgi:hypothetical protein
VEIAWPGLVDERELFPIPLTLVIKPDFGGVRLFEVFDGDLIEG